MYCTNNPVNYHDPNGSCFVKFTSVGLSCLGALVVESFIGAYEKILVATYLVSAEQLAEIGFLDTSPESVKELNKTLRENDITTKDEIAHFLSQCAFESMFGASLTEAGYLDYETQMAYLQKQSYYPYYGAGYIQLTWDYNYEAFYNAIGDEKIMSGPDYVAANYAWTVAGWFWTTHGINDVIASGGTSYDISRIINYYDANTFATRERYYYMIREVLG